MSCEHRGYGKKCTNQKRKENASFCKNHECAETGCRRHVKGLEIYKKNDKKIVQWVRYCWKHRCQYIFGMGNPFGVKCGKRKSTCKH